MSEASRSATRRYAIGGIVSVHCVPRQDLCRRFEVVIFKEGFGLVAETKE